MRVLLSLLLLLASWQNILAAGVVNATQEAISTLLLGPRPDFSVQNVGVLFLNLGGPDNIEAVEGFLYNLFADPDIIRLPPVISLLQKPLAYMIAKRRAPKSAVAYQNIGGGSPIMNYTTAQAARVSELLTKKGYGVRTYIGMRYWHPFTEEALKQLYDDQVTRFVIVPLYPQYSLSTTGSSLRAIQAVFRRNPRKWSQIPHTVIPAWYQRPGYFTAMSGLLLSEWNSFSDAEKRHGVDVLYSAHGVPVSYIEAGDPYQQHIIASANKISAHLLHRLRPTASLVIMNSTNTTSTLFASFTSSSITLRFHLSFQSRVGPVEWLRPYTDDALKNLGAGGCRNLIVVPISFVSEHVETLEEIDNEYHEVAKESGIVNWRRAAALNTDETFLRDVADMIDEALKSPIITIDEALKSQLLPVQRNRGVINRMTGFVQGSISKSVVQVRKLVAGVKKIVEAVVSWVFSRVSSLRKNRVEL